MQKGRLANSCQTSKDKSHLIHASYIVASSFPNTANISSHLINKHLFLSLHITIISLENSTGHLNQFLYSTKLDMDPKVPLNPMMTTPTSNVGELVEPMEPVFNALERMAVHDPPNDTDTENNEAPFDIPEASSSMSARVMATEDAVVELIRVTVIHTKMLKDLQTTSAALSKQLEANKMKLDQLEVNFRALRDAQTSKLMPKHMFDTDKATGDDHLFAVSPSARYSRFLNAFPPHSNTPNTLAPEYINPHGMDMSGLAATLAVAPRLPCSTSPASSRSSSSSFTERRPFKPHRFVTLSSSTQGPSEQG